MELHREEALDEYAVFLVTHRGRKDEVWGGLFVTCHIDDIVTVELHLCVGQNVRPLNKREYILDITTEAETVDANYSLWFRRVIWSLPLKLDNELFVTMHYNQVQCTNMLCNKQLLCLF